MRISIREQLAILILLASLLGLAVLSIAVWCTNHTFVLNVSANILRTTASLKAAQIASNLELMRITASFVTTRILIQQALASYNNGSDTSPDMWNVARADLEAALGNIGDGKPFVLQAEIFPRNASGPYGNYSVLNVTGSNLDIKMPYNHPNGTAVYLGDPDDGGYPPNLYPNLTMSTEYLSSTINTSTATYDQDVLGLGSTLVLGPMMLENNFSIVSFTLPIVNNTSYTDILGWLTVVMDARLIQQVIDSPEGMGKSGEVLLLGPVNATNQFPPGVMYNTTPDPPDSFEVRYLLPLDDTDDHRHPGHIVGTSNAPFDVNEYPAVKQAITQQNPGIDNSGSMLSTHNEANKKVSVGFALPPIEFVDWVVVVERAHSDVWRPIDRLRDIILACVFSVVGFLAIISFPMAHAMVMPIRRLKAASERTIEPPKPRYSRSRGSLGSYCTEHEEDNAQADSGDVPSDTALARKEGLYNPVAMWRNRKRAQDEGERNQNKDHYRIPGKVPEKHHFIQDELTDLTKTFNEMSDELFMQYEKLEERVRQRTEELELSKKAAEAANESKTLFIANISHELKTPLNGILGMCAVSVQEDDPVKLKRSMGIIYKSGDLLLNLLTDLLTFSKNQVGQVLTLDEKEFRLYDVSQQVLAIFDTQAQEGKIDLRVDFDGFAVGGNDSKYGERGDYGPPGTGRMKDMILWGDPHRILQVVINLVSNSLKFTPQGGSVVLTIRVLDETPPARKSSLNSRQSKQSKQSRQSRQPLGSQRGSDATLPGVKTDTANFINAHEKPKAVIAAHERASSPPAGRDLYFEFEVRDTGPGISEELQQRIFEPFVQGDIGLSKKHGGTGLGLSICSQLAGLMMGQINVTSAVGHGSTFTMKLPVRYLTARPDSTASSSVVDVSGPSNVHPPHEVGGSSSLAVGAKSPNRHLSRTPDNITPPVNDGMPTGEATPRLVGLRQPYFASTKSAVDTPGSEHMAAIEQAKNEAQPGSKIRVLVAEDNKVNQEVVLRMLKLEEIYDVTVAKDGQEALDFVKESMAGGDTQPYNLVFMDVQMPNMDGLTSTKLIRQTGFNKPIVALTAFAEESNIQDCYGSGMNYFLAKPIRRPQLKTVLTKYCSPIDEESEPESSPDDPLAGQKSSDGVPKASAAAVTAVQKKESRSQSRGEASTVSSQKKDSLSGSRSRGASPSTANANAHAHADKKGEDWKGKKRETSLPNGNVDKAAEQTKKLDDSASGKSKTGG